MLTKKELILFPAFLIILLMMISGCSSRRPESRVPAREEKVRLTAEPRELLEQLRERNRKISALRTSQAEFEYRLTNTTDPYDGTSLRFAVEKPGKVYARATATAVGDIFYLHTNGERYWVEDSRNDKLYTGTVDESQHLEMTEADELWRNLTPSVLFEALLIDNLDDYSHSSFAIEPDFYIIFLFEENEGSGLTLRRQIWIERESLTVERHRVYNAFGELATEAFLYRYSEVDGIALPHYLRIERYWESISIKFTLEEIVLQEDLPDDLFNYDSPPADFEIIDLDKRENDAKSGKS